MGSYDEEVFASVLRTKAVDGAVTLHDVGDAFLEASPNAVDLLTGGDSTEEDARVFARTHIARELVPRVEELGLRVAVPGTLRAVT